MTKKKFSLMILGCLTALCAAFGVASQKPLNQVQGLAEESGLTYSYAYDASKGSNWINAEVNLPDELIKGGVADMTSVKAMVYEVDNSEQPAFCYTLGIWDADHTAFDDQWHMDNTGSALYVPEKGHPYWASTHWVPAGFKGTVVLPWSTTSYDWTKNTLYNTVNNPVFKTRYCKNNQGTNKELGKGIYYTDGSVGTFPTARMQTKMTFYVHNDWNQLTENITFSNIRFVEDYDEYLKKAATYDSESIGEASNQIPLEGAIGFNSAAHMSMTYKMQSGGGTTVTSLDNNVGLALRMKNMSANTLNLEVKINESSSEILFLCNTKEMDIPFIHVDGRVETIKAKGGIRLPAGYDGTVIIPNYAWALADNPNKPADLNGRLHGQMWAFFWFAHAIGSEQTFAIAEINQIYASYNAATDKTEYTLKPMKTAANGADVNYVKNENSWDVGNGEKFVVGSSSALTLTEKLDGEASTENLSSINANTVYYKENISLAMTVKPGRVIESVLVNGEDVTAFLTEGEGVKTYAFTNAYNDGTPIEISVNYITAFNVTYELDGGINDSRNVNMYKKINRGEDAIPVYPAVKANYRFLGWFNRVEFSHPDAFEITALDYDFFTSKGYSDADIKLYAAYATDYTVNIVDGDEVTPLNLLMGKSLQAEDLKDFEKEGHVASYYLDSEYTQAVDFPYAANTHGSNVYVKYEKHSYSVKFQSLGGTQIAAQTVSFGDQAAKPANPVREGYRFDGWFTRDDYDSEFSFDQAIKGDTVVYAKWTYVQDKEDAKKLTTITIINSIVLGLGLCTMGFVVIPRLKKR